MDKTKRRPVIAGNWKMNKTVAEGKSLLLDILPLAEQAPDCDVVLCLPYLHLPMAVELAGNSRLKLGAQNVHWEEKGAFTGEISPKMLADLGVEYVLVGHSERRQYFGETDETVNRRTAAALAAGLKVILCVGETEVQRAQGVTEEVVSMQVKIALRGVPAEQLKNLIIAYEPVWAIGTGQTATPQQANDVCCYLRWVVEELYEQQAASHTPILYGGSMNAQNAVELLAEEDIDGGLIGSASLKAADFAQIIAAAVKPASREED